MKKSEPIVKSNAEQVTPAIRTIATIHQRPVYRLLRVLPAAAISLALTGLILAIAMGTAGQTLLQPLDIAGTASVATTDARTSGQMIFDQALEGAAGINRGLITLRPTARPSATETQASPSISPETSSTEAPTPSPIPEQTPSPVLTVAPTPYPRVLDAAGIPQEGMPVEDFTADDTTIYVKVNEANLRDAPNTSAAVIERLTMGEPLQRLGYGLDWSSVITSGGQRGYVLSSLISKTAVPTPTPKPKATPTPKPTPKPSATPSPKPTPEPTAIPAPTPEPTIAPDVTAAPDSTTAPAEPTPTPAPAGSVLTDEQKQAMIDLARSLIGTKYVYAKMSPAEGFDCSGFTSYIYKTLFAVKLPRSASSQSYAGIAVSSAEIQIGDILCFDWSGSDGICDHVGLYVGDSKYIHASSSDRTYFPDSGAVKESIVNFSRNPIVSIRRIIN